MLMMLIGLVAPIGLVSRICENRNPNSESAMNMINQPSSSNPLIKPVDKEAQEEKNEEGGESTNPNWLELPEDVWFMILSKLKTIDIIENAQKVCMLFRKLCKQPAMFKIIDMFLPDAFMDLPCDLNVMTRFAVDRSAGGLIGISLEQLCDDDTLMYIVERSKNLKRLVLQHYVYVSDKGLIEAVKKLPTLEELQLIICKFCDDAVEAVGHACPSLKSFSLNQVASKNPEFAEFGDQEACAIARSMPQLRHLQLIGSDMTNEGLKAILDGCLLLESLDLRGCFHINLSGDLGRRCERIKRVRYPNDSTEDYAWQVYNPAYDEWRDQQESECDYYYSDMSGLHQYIFDPEDFGDEYDDFFREDDNYRIYCDYYRDRIFPGYDSSD